MPWVLIATWVLPLIIAITFHEAAHGYVAWRLGDDTAHRMGRVSFNPLRHIDLFGTLILPGILILTHAGIVFGYAKPVPVNFARLRNPRRDMVWVAAAGPGINLILALAAAVSFYGAILLPDWIQIWVWRNLDNMILINVLLAVFNMIPLPPLDGGRVAVGLLPRGPAMALARLEPYGMLILIAILFLPPLIGNLLGTPFSLLAWLIGPPVEFVYNLILSIVGLGRG